MGSRYTRKNVYDACGLPIRGPDGTSVPRPDRTHRHLNRSFIEIHDYNGKKYAFVFITKETAENKYGYDDTVSEGFIEWCKNKRFKNEAMIGKSVHVFHRKKKTTPYLYIGVTPLIKKNNCTDTHVRMPVPQMGAATALLCL